MKKSAQVTTRFKSIINGLAIAAAAGGAALAAMGRKFANTGDKLDKMSKRTGLTVEELSELSHAANLSGTDLDQLTQAMFRANRRIGNAITNTGPAVRALKELGLNARQVSDMETIEQFDAVVSSLSRYSNEAR